MWYKQVRERQYPGDSPYFLVGLREREVAPEIVVRIGIKGEKQREMTESKKCN